MTLYHTTHSVSAPLLTGSVLPRKLSFRERFDFFPRLFPDVIGNLPAFIWGEAHLYKIAGQIYPRYHGGQWDFYKVSEEQGYAAPRLTENSVTISCGLLSSHSRVTADALGLIVTLLTVEKALQATHNKHYDQLLNALKQFSQTHAENLLIFRALQKHSLF